MKKPNVIFEFNGDRPQGDVIDGARDLIAEAEPRLNADPETGLLTVEEIEAQYA